MWKVLIIYFLVIIVIYFRFNFKILLLTNLFSFYGLIIINLSIFYLLRKYELSYLGVISTIKYLHLINLAVVVIFSFIDVFIFKELVGAFRNVTLIISLILFVIYLFVYSFIKTGSII